MKRRRPLAMPALAATALTVSLLAAAVVAQDTPTPVPAAPAPVVAAGAKPAEANGGKPAEGAAQPGEAKSKADSATTPARPSPQRFEPTEKVRPDFDVAFPVDI